jgi:hypothetical protein
MKSVKYCISGRLLSLDRLWRFARWLRCHIVVYNALDNGNQFFRGGEEKAWSCSCDKKQFVTEVSTMKGRSFQVLEITRMTSVPLILH